MSICLVVSKSIATASAGIYAGMMVTRNLLISPEEYLHCSGKAVGDDAAGGKERRLQAHSIVSGALAAVSTVFFGMSYVGAPAHWKHPYLIYCCIGVPLTWVASMAGTLDWGICGLSGLCTRESAEDKSASTEARREVEYENSSLSDDHDDIISEDSIVDLGRHEEPAATEEDAGRTATPESAGVPEQRPVAQAKPCHALTRYTASAFSVLVFVASVVGCLGETL